MNNKTIKVTFNNYEVKEFPKGTTLKSISDSYKDYYQYDILIGKVDNDLVDLADPISKSCKVTFYDRSSSVGNSVYSSSVNFILTLAVKNVLGENAQVIIEHSIDKGVFCRIKDQQITEDLLQRLESEMREIVEDNYLFTKLSVARTDAIKYFKKKNKFDKVNVLKYISNTYINLYRINDLYDYFYGKMAYSTKQINDFKLNYVSSYGFVLSIPDTINPECTLDYVHHEKVFDSFQKYHEFGRKVNIENAADLNLMVSNTHINELVYLAEAFYDSQLVDIAEEISKGERKIRVILLAGPSSSGKTTTATKLKTYIKSRGINVYQLSTDDYFFNKDKTPLNANGEYDFESLSAVDVDLFNKHLLKLLALERVEIPSYNFILGKREYNKKYIQLGDNDVIIIEGIHALNDLLTMAIERDKKYKIYISPLTNLNIDNHNHIHTSDIRRLRRIIRDSKTRGINAADTLRMWPAITLGEQNNIYTYQDEVDKVINSALVYEIGVLKTYVEPLLFSVDEDDDVYPEALRLINLLRNFLPIAGDVVPEDSLLREFIGGSCFRI